MTDSKVTEAMVEAAMTEMFGVYHDWNNHQAWVDPHWPAAKRKLTAALSAALVQAPVQVGEIQTANCCKCGRIIDKREMSEGGDAFGAEMTDGRWTCSMECWEAVVDPEALALPLPVQEPVAWLHPTANWSHVNYQAIRIHCPNDGPMPVPLYLSPSPSIPEEKGGTAESVAVECTVSPMKTSAGTDFYVHLRCGDRTITPHMFKEEWKADYEVAEWKWFFGQAEKPDILAYGPRALRTSPTGGQTVKEGSP